VTNWLLLKYRNFSEPICSFDTKTWKTCMSFTCFQCFQSTSRFQELRLSNVSIFVTLGFLISVIGRAQMAHVSHKILCWCLLCLLPFRGSPLSDLPLINCVLSGEFLAETLLSPALMFCLRSYGGG
jgi:hypothetical protein